MASGFQCLGCLDYETDCALTRLPCGQHAICLDCIRRMVQFAVEEEKQYPLRCGAATCPDISTQLVRDLLNSSSDAALLDRFQEKIAEYAVPASQRTYCASRECCSAQGESRYLDAKVFSDDHLSRLQLYHLLSLQGAPQRRRSTHVHHRRS